MSDRKDIPYRKKLPPKSTKQLGSGGPRDMQRRRDFGMGVAKINMPQINMDALKEVIMNNKEMREELKAELREEIAEIKEVVTSSKSLEGIGLPFDVVEQKIKEAVENTEKNVRDRYESGISSLNNQLNEAKAQIKDLNKRLSERKSELVDVKKNLEEKNSIIDGLREKQNQEINGLKSTILELIEKVKTGKITRYNYDEESRPILDDKVFIDPLDTIETDLDAYININVSDFNGDRRDLKSDVQKLKGLLGGNKFKPSESRIED